MFLKVSSAVLLLLAVLHCIDAYTTFSHQKLAKVSFRASRSTNCRLFCTAKEDGEVLDLSEENLQSAAIEKLKNKNSELQTNIEATREEILAVEKQIVVLDEEYGSEITRIKKEFARIKERSYEEAVEISNKAKVDALKEVLPINDNWGRAKQLFEPLETEGETAVFKTYEEIFTSLTNIIADFGCEKVESLGQPFDFNFMEAIMTQPSTEFAKDIVSMEYQIGYKMGDKCVRPSMVIVSLGPGPE